MDSYFPLFLQQNSSYIHGIDTTQGSLLDSSIEGGNVESGRDESFNTRSPPPTPPPHSEESGGRRVHKSLHAKLSSPDRRKPSPLEAKRKLDEKHHLAQMNREMIDNARMAKLKVNFKPIMT
jgi:hypothetical protein